VNEGKEGIGAPKDVDCLEATFHTSHLAIKRELTSYDFSIKWKSGGLVV